MKAGTTREDQYQRTYVTRNGLVFSSLAGAYFMAIITTACTFSSERTRYYQVYSNVSFYSMNELQNTQTNITIITITRLLLS